MHFLDEVIPQLEAAVQNVPGHYQLRANIYFQFYPSAVGGGGENKPWQALLTLSTIAICEYGATLEEAAQRLLDRYQHPEKYEEDIDD